MHQKHRKLVSRQPLQLCSPQAQAQQFQSHTELLQQLLQAATVKQQELVGIQDSVDHHTCVPVSGVP